MDLERFSQNQIGFSISLFYAPVLHEIVHEHVAAGLVEDQRGIGLERVIELHYRRKRFLIDLDKLEGILRDIAILGSHGCDRLAHVSDFIDRHDILRRRPGDGSR